MSTAFAIASGTASTWLFLRFLIPQLRRRLLDYPNARSSHSQPIPRGGGVCFVVVTTVSSAIELFSGQGLSAVYLPLLAAPLAVVGLYDDFHNLPSTFRYGFQLVTAAFILLFSPLIQAFIPAVTSGNWMFLIVLVFLVISVTAVINFINFMDGLDGLVGGCMAVSIAAVSFSLNAPWSMSTLVGAGWLFILQLEPRQGLYG